MSETQLLIVSADGLGSQMVGPALRYLYLAKALSVHCQVTLAAPKINLVIDNQLPNLSLIEYNASTGAELDRLIKKSSVILSGGVTFYHYPALLNHNKPVVVDLYDPFPIADLVLRKHQSQIEQNAYHRFLQSVMAQQLRRGDYFICSSETQRAFWLGALYSNGKVNPEAFNADNTLRQLIDVVPFGVPDEPPLHNRQVIKGIYPGIEKDDYVIYWGGGIWDWLDPLTAIRAMGELRNKQPRAKLFFAGVGSPNSNVPTMQMLALAQTLSQELGLVNKQVFFNKWVSYNDRGNFLLEADVGLSLHFDHVEAQLAFRTRLLDYVWAGLPMVVTQGEQFGDLAASKGLALTTMAGDYLAVAKAVIYWLERDDRRKFIAQEASHLANLFRWSKVIAPLVNFCSNPKRLLRSTPNLRISASLLTTAWRSFRSRGLINLINDIRVYFTQSL